MPSSESPLPVAEAALPVALADLFDGVGTTTLSYAPACRTLNGQRLTVTAELTRSHDGQQWLAVSEAGICPDCSPTPVAVLQLNGLALPEDFVATGSLRLQGRLSYGFAVDAQGNASFLRLEEAQLVTEPVAS